MTPADGIVTSALEQKRDARFAALRLLVCTEYGVQSIYSRKEEESLNELE